MENVDINALTIFPLSWQMTTDAGMTLGQFLWVTMGMCMFGISLWAISQSIKDYKEGYIQFKNLVYNIGIIILIMFLGLSMTYIAHIGGLRWAKDIAVPIYTITEYQPYDQIVYVTVKDIVPVGWYLSSTPNGDMTLVIGEAKNYAIGTIDKANLPHYSLLVKIWDLDKRLKPTTVKKQEVVVPDTPGLKLLETKP